MKVYNVRKESVNKLMEALKVMGVANTDVWKNLDVNPDGSATYYAKNFMEHAALRSVAIH